MTESGKIESKDSTVKPEFSVLARPHPLKTQTFVASFEVGNTLTSVVGDQADDTIEIRIEGEYIPREMWERIRPKAGTSVSVVRYPQGRTVKKVIGVILLVIIAIYAPYLLSYMYAAFGMWGAVLAIGITLLATMAAYALIPPPTMPRLSGGEGAEFNRLNAITGTSNQAVPYGTIPMVIGECRYYPTLAANPYTEILGDQQYLRMLFDLGYGDLEISDIKIGETDISSFEGVEYEISETPELFSDDIFEITLSDAFNDYDVVTKTTQTLTDEVSVDIVFPGGLFGVNDKGNSTQAVANFGIEFREVGDPGAWTAVASLPIAQRTISAPSTVAISDRFKTTSSARKMVRVGVRWDVPQGQYDVRISRYATTFASGTKDSTKFYSAQLSSIRSIKHTNPSKTGTLKLALRIKASDQLNGVINQLSVLGQQKIRVYDSLTDTWSVPVVNTNPAWIYHWLLTTCPGVAQLVDDSRVDLPAFEAWAADCVAKGFTCKGMVDKALPSGELFRMVLSSGRASFAMRDGMYSVLYDNGETVPVQHFSPANSSDFSGQRIFVDLPHGLRVRFQNPALNWQEDEIIVLDDGYTYNGLDSRGIPSADPAAEKFETMTVPFVTEPRAAWQLARYQLAQGKYRANVYSWSADIEHLICTRGDLVYMVHDVTDWGAGFGLVKDVGSLEGAVVQILTAEPLELEVGETYSVRVRTRDGESHISVISSVSTDGKTIDLTTPMPLTVQTGDLYLVGKTSNEIRKVLVTKIEPSADMRATITGVDFVPELLTYDDDPPDTFISAISGTSILEPPPPPVLYAVFSDQNVVPPNDGGNTIPSINIGIGGGSGYINPKPINPLGDFRIVAP